MSRWIKRSIIFLALVLLIAIAVVAASVLTSLDWVRRHTKATAELPVWDSSIPNGLVQIEANNMRFRARVYGLDNTGSALILLHGFPEISAMWEPLAEAAANAGHRVVAFDQRGYSPAARPKGIEAYAGDKISGDVLAVADALGFKHFHLVGHDWGCCIGWTVVAQHPERVLSWSGMSIPRPDTLLDFLVENPPLYVTLFTQPLVPEIILLWNRASLLRKNYSTHRADEKTECLRVFTEPGALTAALNWYRAIPITLNEWNPSSDQIQTPTLFLYGKQELWVTPERLQQQRARMSGPYKELMLDAGHWLIQEKPVAVLKAILAHIGRYDPVAPVNKEQSPLNSGI